MCNSPAALGWKSFPPTAATYSIDICRWAETHLPSLFRSRLPELIELLGTLLLIELG